MEPPAELIIQIQAKETALNGTMPLRYLAFLSNLCILIQHIAASFLMNKRVMVTVGTYHRMVTCTAFSDWTNADHIHCQKLISEDCWQENLDSPAASLCTRGVVRNLM